MADPLRDLPSLYSGSGFTFATRPLGPSLQTETHHEACSVSKAPKARPRAAAYCDPGRRSSMLGSGQIPAERTPARGGQTAWTVLHTRRQRSGATSHSLRAASELPTPSRNHPSAPWDPALRVIGRLRVLNSPFLSATPFLPRLFQLRKDHGAGGRAQSVCSGSGLNLRQHRGPVPFSGVQRFHSMSLVSQMEKLS